MLFTKFYGRGQLDFRGSGGKTVEERGVSMEASTRTIVMDYGYWGEHPEHSIEDWKTLVANDDVRMGYWDWVEGRVRHEAGL